MERVVRTLELDGHVVAVVERVDDTGSSYVLLVDREVVDADLDVTGVPDDRVIERAVRTGRSARQPAGPARRQVA